MNSSLIGSTAIRIALGILNVLVVAIGIAGVAQVRQKASLVVTLESRGDRVYIDAIDTRTPTHVAAVLNVMDTILYADGLPVRSVTEIETILDGARIGDEVPFVVRRGSQTFETRLVLAAHYSTSYAIIVVLVSALFFVLGVFVLIKRPEQPEAMTFHLAMNCVAVMISCTAGSYVIEPYGLGHAVRVVDLFAYAFMTVLFFHFTLQFPTPKWGGLRRRVTILYVAAALVASINATTFLLATTVSSTWLSWHADAFDICQKFFGILGLLSVASFVHSYRTALEESERIKLRWVLTGVTVGFLSFIFLQLIPQWLGSAPLVEEEWIVLMAAVAPVTFAIAIVRYRVMDLDLLLSRSTVYAIVLGAVVVVQIGVVWALGTVAHTLSDASPFIATAIIALLFEPARSRVQHFVDRRFFRTRYNLRQAQRTLADELGSCAETARLAATATDILNGILAPERIALTTIRRDDNAVALLATDALAGSDSTLAIAPPVQIVPGEVYASERWIEHGVAVSREADEMLEQLGVCCAIAAPISDRDLAVLMVGPKKSGTRYTIEDLDVLRAAITHTSSGLERIMLQTNILRREAEAEHLRELNRMKSYFVSSVTHELKTPLTSIRMFAEMLQSERTVEQDRVRRYARIIESESQRLARLIDNVLDFSKIERGTKEYRFVPIELTEIVDGVLDSLEHQIASAGFRLERTDGDGPLELVGDPDAITGALVNLISNAVKYSSATREIRIRTFRRDDFAGVSVADRGIGMSEEDRAHVFDPFFRAESGKTIGAAGTGLGLALVRHVVEAHRGSIELESREGVGSTFTLLFPLTSIPSHEESSADRG